MEVGDSVKVAMLLQLGVLLDDNYSILEDSLINSLLDWCWDKNHLETKLKYQISCQNDVFFHPS